MTIIGALNRAILLNGQSKAACHCPILHGFSRRSIPIASISAHGHDEAGALFHEKINLAITGLPFSVAFFDRSPAINFVQPINPLYDSCPCFATNRAPRWHPRFGVSFVPRGHHTDLP
jgi:hypothetical protein